MKIDALKVKILLAEQNMTQGQLAVRCQVTRQNLSRILAKERCHPATAGRIASGLGVHVTDIMKEVQ